MRKENDNSVQHPTRERIARAMKLKDALTVREISASLGVTFEAARKTLAEMQREGMAEHTSVATGRGRPAKKWALTPLGEKLLPTKTSELLSQMLGEISSSKNQIFSKRLFAEMADSKAQKILDSASTANDEARDNDEFVSIEKIDGQTAVVEKNCPFIDVSLDHPSICSLTTNVIGQVSGKKVKRAKSFQAGDGMCVFVMLDNTSWDGFEFEDEVNLKDQTDLDRH
jgi:predicted ArsR family transcriptional regulator